MNTPVPFHRIRRALVPALVVLYHLLKLTGIAAIAVFAYLIYQRMPLTLGEYQRIKTDRALLKDMGLSRIPVVSIRGLIDVDVKNTSFDVNVTNDSLDVEVKNSSLPVDIDQPIDVHVTDEPLPVRLQR